MRTDLAVRAITATATLTLVASSAAFAQTDADTRFPSEVPPTILTAVITNTLDDSTANALIVSTAKNYHTTGLGGKPNTPEVPKKGSDKEPKRGGFIASGPFEGSDAVTQAALDMAGEKDPDLIVVSGGDWKANVGIARTNPATTVIDLGQPEPCLTDTGRPAESAADCVDAEGTVPGNYAAMEFAVEEGAYLAGVVAARESRGLPLGIISGTGECLECDRYVTGFINGALSVEPDIEIIEAELASDEVAGFGDEASAKTFAEAFIAVHEPGVLLPVGRGATMGMVEAACEAEIKVIGAGIDISAQRPDFERADCVMASITTDTMQAVEEAMYYFSSGENPPVITYDLQGGGIVVTDEWRLSPSKRVDTNEFYEAAEIAVRTDQVEPCPDGCGVFLPGETAEATTAG